MYATEFQMDQTSIQPFNSRDEFNFDNFFSKWSWLTLWCSWTIWWKLIHTYLSLCHLKELAILVIINDLFWEHFVWNHTRWKCPSIDAAPAPPVSCIILSRPTRSANLILNSPFTQLTSHLVMLTNMTDTRTCGKVDRANSITPTTDAGGKVNAGLYCKST